MFGHSVQVLAARTRRSRSVYTRAHTCEQLARVVMVVVVVAVVVGGQRTSIIIARPRRTTRSR